MKRLFALVLALSLLIGVVPLAAMAEEESKTALPAVGDVVEGFEVKEIRAFELYGAQLIYFEHQRTGAKLLWIANEDTNRAFQIGFPTRMENDKGLPHVFEHATTKGSDKYPSGTLMMNVSNQAYITYMNAYTADALTCYPVASLSEEQLLKLAEFYADLCFNPLILKDEKEFRTEAWRYEMADMDSDLTYNGTVYSEMLGAITLELKALHNANGITFPGASISYNQGGNPEAIPDMTYEEVREYHSKFYHPSNSLSILYGSFGDYTAFLKILDETFAPFEKAEISLEEAGYTRITEPVTETFAWPVTEGTDTANQTCVIYYILCPGMKGDVAQEQLIDHACDLLYDDGSPLMKALKKAFPAGTFAIGRELAAPDDAVAVQAVGLNEGDAERFRQIVDAALAEAAENGFDAALVDNLTTSLKFGAKLAPEDGNPVDGIMESFEYTFAVTGDIFRSVDDYESLGNIPEENGSGALAAAVKTWLVEPALWTLSSTSPAPGEKEKEDAELAAKLAEIKAGMTEEEKQAIIDATNAPEEKEDNAELVAELTPVTIATLPEEVKEYAIRDEKDENGIRRIEVPAGVDGISYISLNLDLTALPQEDIHYMRLFTRLLGHMSTNAHSWEELELLIPRYLYDHTFGIAVNAWKGSCHPYMCVNWYSLDEDLEAGYNLASEILWHTDFTDTETLLERIQGEKNNVRSSINSLPYSVLYYRQQAIENEGLRYYSYLNYLEYYDFLVELEKTMEENPEEVVARLEKTQQFLASRDGAVAGAAGSEESLVLNRPLAEAFFADLDDAAREAAQYDLPVPAKKEGLIIDGNIQYNIVSAGWDKIDPEASSQAYNAFGNLLVDKLLTPMIRDQLGAYGAYCDSSDETIVLWTYRDPNVAETFACFDSLPDEINALEVSQADVDKYIINGYSSLAKPAGELTGAIAAMDNRLAGKPDDLTLQAMRAMKTATPESLKEFAGEIAALLNTGVRGTAGSAAAVNANAEMYDVILNPFGAVDMSQVGIPDVAEDHEYYEAIRMCVDNGYMKLREDGTFAPDESATAGEFLAAICALIGQPMDEAGAVSFFAGYGLVSPQQEPSGELNEQLVCDILVNGFGVQIATDTPDAAVSRGDLADLLMQLGGE
ncbi:MAG: insulinase family protein [Clostridiales bacterium]|nr:insulinase family protein [Clostridiales bacterium]